ncbi:MAG: protein-export membrane protein SecF [Actinobacteria bacterium RBG_16_68_21]|nr:MAG: protein-export membrane protein SecF [Actinobacteria bacterium RBG_16_68_21]
MSVWRDLYHGSTTFDFFGARRRWFAASALIIVVSLGALAIRHLNLGVDFEGGTLVEMENPQGASVAMVRDAIETLGIVGAKVQATGGGAGLRVQTSQLAPANEDALVETVAALAGVDPGEASRQSVGPTFGSAVAASALRALIIFLIVVALFITWRMEWKMAATALLALGHDLIFTAGIYALVGFEVTPATVIAILTILGYSLYDTVVVYDKVQENVKERGDRHTFAAIVNMSMNQVFMRSVNTSLTSLLPIGSLLFVGSFLLGATTLREFALALFIGVATGTYSSIFLAAPILGVWKEGEEHWIRVRRRLERRGGDEEFAAKAAAPRPATTETVASVRDTSGAAPRPPRKRRKKR